MVDAVVDAARGNARGDARVGGTAREGLLDRLHEAVSSLDDRVLEAAVRILEILAQVPEQRSGELRQLVQDAEREGLR